MKDFNEMKKTFCNIANDPKADPTEYAEALQETATAFALSVLKKVLDPKVVKTENNKKVIKGTVDKKTGKETPTNSGFNPLLVQMRYDIKRTSSDLDRLIVLNDEASDLVFNKDGDLKEKTVDPEAAKAAAKIGRENLGDGQDLVNEAVAAILEEIAKATDRDPGLPFDFDRPYTVRQLKKKVWIKLEDSVGGWETVETTPIQEIYKAIRRSIANSKAMQADPRNGYSYLEDVATDPEDGETVTK